MMIDLSEVFSIQVESRKSSLLILKNDNLEIDKV